VNCYNGVKNADIVQIIVMLDLMKTT